MTRSEWTKIRKSWPGVWRHVSGWTIYHCGHLTALWPYFAAPPGYDMRCPREKMLLQGGIGLGHAFQKLVYAQDAVEAIAAKEARR